MQRIALFWPGDLRRRPNELAEPSAEEATRQLERAFDRLGRQTYRVPLPVEAARSIEKLGPRPDGRRRVHCSTPAIPKACRQHALAARQTSGQWPDSSASQHRLEMPGRPFSRIWDHCPTGRATRPMTKNGAPPGADIPSAMRASATPPGRRPRGEPRPPPALILILITVTLAPRAPARIRRAQDRSGVIRRGPAIAPPHRCRVQLRPRPPGDVPLARARRGRFLRALHARTAGAITSRSWIRRRIQGGPPGWQYQLGLPPCARRPILPRACSTPRRLEPTATRSPAPPKPTRATSCRMMKRLLKKKGRTGGHIPTSAGAGTLPVGAAEQRLGVRVQPRPRHAERRVQFPPAAGASRWPWHVCRRACRAITRRAASRATRCGWTSAAARSCAARSHARSVVVGPPRQWLSWPPTGVGRDTIMAHYLSNHIAVPWRHLPGDGGASRTRQDPATKHNVKGSWGRSSRKIFP